MHRQGRGELVPFDPEIERTINRIRRGRRVLAAHNRYLANMVENLQQGPNLRDENGPPGGDGNRGNNNACWRFNLISQICYWGNFLCHLQSYSS